MYCLFQIHMKSFDFFQGHGPIYIFILMYTYSAPALATMVHMHFSCTFLRYIWPNICLITYSLKSVICCVAGSRTPVFLLSGETSYRIDDLATHGPPFKLYFCGPYIWGRLKFLFSVVNFCGRYSDVVRLFKYCHKVETQI